MTTELGNTSGITGNTPIVDNPAPVTEVAPSVPSFDFAAPDSSVVQDTAAPATTDPTANYAEPVRQALADPQTDVNAIRQATAEQNFNAIPTVQALRNAQDEQYNQTVLDSLRVPTDDAATRHEAAYAFDMQSSVFQLADAKQMLEKKSAVEEYQQFKAEYPEFVQHLADNVDSAAIARGDLSLLGRVGDGVQSVKKGWRSAYVNARAGWEVNRSRNQYQNINLKESFGVGLTPEEVYTKKVLKHNIAQLAQAATDNNGLAGNTVFDTFGSAPDNISGMVAKYATTAAIDVGAAAIGGLSSKSVAGGVAAVKATHPFAKLAGDAVFIGQTYAAIHSQSWDVYSEMTDENGVKLDHSVALGATILSSAVQTAIEYGLTTYAFEKMMPTNVLTGTSIGQWADKEFVKQALKQPAVKQFLREFGANYMKAAAAEGFEEFTQNLTQDLFGVLAERVQAVKPTATELADTYSGAISSTVDSVAQAASPLNPAALVIPAAKRLSQFLKDGDHAAAAPPVDPNKPHYVPSAWSMKRVGASLSDATVAWYRGTLSAALMFSPSVMLNLATMQSKVDKANTDAAKTRDITDAIVKSKMMDKSKTWMEDFINKASGNETMALSPSVIPYLQQTGKDPYTTLIALGATPENIKLAIQTGSDIAVDSGKVYMQEAQDKKAAPAATTTAAEGDATPKLSESGVEIVPPTDVGILAHLRPAPSDLTLYEASTMSSDDLFAKYKDAAVALAPYTQVALEAATSAQQVGDEMYATLSSLTGKNGKPLYSERTARAYADMYRDVFRTTGIREGKDPLLMYREARIQVEAVDHADWEARQQGNAPAPSARTFTAEQAAARAAVATGYRGVPEGAPAYLHAYRNGATPEQANAIAIGYVAALQGDAQAAADGVAPSTGAGRLYPMLDSNGVLSILENDPASYNYTPQQYSQNAAPFGGAEVATTPIGDVTEVEVDGVMRPALNSEGQAIHWSLEGVRNFWRWFGDSKVVDSQGRPRVYSGLYVRSDRPAVLKLERETYERAYREGRGYSPEILRREGYPDWLMREHPTLPHLMRSAREFFNIGVDQAPFPDVVVARRAGRVAPTGISMNYRDNVAERGVSVLGVLSSETGRSDITSDPVSASFLTNKEQYVIGFLHTEVGSDGESLLLNAKDLGGFTNVKSAIGNSGAFDPKKSSILLQSDLLTPDSMPSNPLSLYDHLAANNFIRTVMHKQETIESPVSVVMTPSDAAAALGYLAGEAQEHLVALVTDKAGKILSIVQHRLGSGDASTIGWQGVIVGNTLNIEGAAQVWIAHNHPSGLSTPSDADIRFNQDLMGLFKATGKIDYRGHIVVGAEDNSYLDSFNYPMLVVPRSNTPAKGKKVPVMRRKVERLISPRAAINSPDDVRALVAEIQQQGVLLFDTQHRPVGFVTMTYEEMSALRDPKNVKLGEMLQAIDKTNAAAAVVVSDVGLSAGDNVASALNAYAIRTLDILHRDVVAEGSVAYRSAAEGTGKVGNTNGVFKQDAAPFEGTEVATTPIGDVNGVEVDGVMRPALNSEGQAIHWSLEGVRNFWRWFGDSKVVDSQGRPIVVYHGTSHSFDTFSNAELGKSTAANSAALAHFFVDSARVASTYAEHAATSAPVLNMLAEADRLEKIAQRTNKSSDWDAYDNKVIEAENFEQALRDNSLLGQNVMPVYLRMSDVTEIDAEGEVYTALEESMTKTLKRAKSQKKDGVIIRNFDDSAGGVDLVADHFAIFDPTSIKSATGNSGAFDPTESSILYQSDVHKVVKSTKQDAKAEAFYGSPVTLMDDVQEGVPAVVKFLHATNDGVFETIRDELLREGALFGTSSLKVSGSYLDDAAGLTSAELKKRIAKPSQALKIRTIADVRKLLAKNRLTYSQRAPMTWFDHLMSEAYNRARVWASPNLTADEEATLESVRDAGFRSPNVSALFNTYRYLLSKKVSLQNNLEDARRDITARGAADFAERMELALDLVNNHLDRLDSLMVREFGANIAMTDYEAGDAGANWAGDEYATYARAIVKADSLEGHEPEFPEVLNMQRDAAASVVGSVVYGEAYKQVVNVHRRPAVAGANGKIITTFTSEPEAISVVRTGGVAGIVNGGGGSVILPFYGHLQNPMVFDAEGAAWNKLAMPVNLLPEGSDGRRTWASVLAHEVKSAIDNAVEYDYMTQASDDKTLAELEGRQFDAAAVQLTTPTVYKLINSYNGGLEVKISSSIFEMVPAQLGVKTGGRLRAILSTDGDAVSALVQWSPIGTTYDYGGKDVYTIPISVDPYAEMTPEVISTIVDTVRDKVLADGLPLPTTMNTRALARLAGERGHDAVIIKNVLDYGGSISHKGVTPETVLAILPAATGSVKYADSKFEPSSAGSRVLFQSDMYKHVGNKTQDQKAERYYGAPIVAAEDLVTGQHAVLKTAHAAPHGLRGGEIDESELREGALFSSPSSKILRSYLTSYDATGKPIKSLLAKGAPAKVIDNYTDAKKVLEKKGYIVEERYYMSRESRDLIDTLRMDVMHQLRSGEGRKQLETINRIRQHGFKANGAAEATDLARRLDTIIQNDLRVLMLNKSRYQNSPDLTPDKVEQVNFARARLAEASEAQNRLNDILTQHYGASWFLHYDLKARGGVASVKFDALDRAAAVVRADSDVDNALDLEPVWSSKALKNESLRDYDQSSADEDTVVPDITYTTKQGLLTRAEDMSSFIATANEVSSSTSRTIESTSGVIVPLYVDAQNPMVFDAQGKNWNRLEYRAPVTAMAGKSASALGGLVRDRLNKYFLGRSGFKEGSTTTVGEVLATTPAAPVTVDLLTEGGANSLGLHTMSDLRVLVEYGESSATVSIQSSPLQSAVGGQWTTEHTLTVGASRSDTYFKSSNAIGSAVSDYIQRNGVSTAAVVNTRALTRIAGEQGHDVLVIKNVTDYGGGDSPAKWTPETVISILPPAIARTKVAHAKFDDAVREKRTLYQRPYDSGAVAQLISLVDQANNATTYDEKATLKGFIYDHYNALHQQKGLPDQVIRRGRQMGVSAPFDVQEAEVDYRHLNRQLTLLTGVSANVDGSLSHDAHLKLIEGLGQKIAELDGVTSASLGLGVGFYAQTPEEAASGKILADMDRHDARLGSIVREVFRFARDNRQIHAFVTLNQTNIPDALPTSAYPAMTLTLPAEYTKDDAEQMARQVSDEVLGLNTGATVGQNDDGAYTITTVIIPDIELWYDPEGASSKYWEILHARTPAEKDAAVIAWRESEKDRMQSWVLQHLQGNYAALDMHDVDVVVADQTNYDRYLTDGKAQTDSSKDSHLGDHVADKIQRAQARQQEHASTARAEFLYSREPEQIRPRGAITLDNAGRRISLFEKTDKSTFIHESGHLFFDMIGHLATQPDASPELRQMLADTLEALGADSYDSITVEQHEYFADGFLNWFATGDAPTNGLGAMFKLYRSWLLPMLQQGKFQHIDVPAKLRKAYSRLLATDAELNAYEQQANLYKGMMSSAADMYSDPEDRQKYLDAIALAVVEARDYVQQRIMEDTQREETKVWRDEERTLTAEVQQELMDSSQTYRALVTLSSTTAGSPRLIDDEIVEKYGEGALEDLKLAGVVATEFDKGVEPIMLAEAAALTGYDDQVGEMVRALSAGSAEDMVLRIVTKRMADKYATFASSSSKAMKDAVINAVQNEHATQLLEMEIKALRDKVKVNNIKLDVPTDALIMLARDSVDHLPRAQINADSFAASEIRASNMAQLKFSEGDMDAALQWKRAQLFEHARYRAAVAVKARFDKIDTYLAKVSTDKKTRARIALAGVSYVQQIDNLLARFKLTRQAPHAEAIPLLEWSKVEGDEIGIEPAIGDFSGSAATGNRATLTPAQTEDIYSTVRAIQLASRIKVEGITQQRRESIQKLSEDLGAEAYANLDKLPVSDSYSQSKGDRAVSVAKRYLAEHTRMEWMFRKLDGFKNQGKWWRAFYEPFMLASNAEQLLWEQVSKRLTDIFLTRYSQVEMAHRRMERVAIPEFGNIRYTKEEIFTMLLNLGNADNEARLMVSVKADRATIDKVLARELTAADFEMANEIWAMIDEMFWDKVAAVQTRINGVPPKKVQAVPFASPYGQEMRGGYYPIMYDQDKSIRAYEISEKKAHARIENTFANKMTESGHRKERVNGTPKMALQLGLSVLEQHLANVTHDVTHTLPLIDAYQLMRNANVQKAIVETLGIETYRQMVPWLQGIANDSRKPQTVVDRILLGYVKSGVTSMLMGYKVMTALVQPLGYTVSVDYLLQNGKNGGKYAVKALGVLSPTELSDAKAFMLERSVQMKNRRESFDRDVRDMLKGQGVNTISHAMRHNMMYLTATTDFGVSMVTWHAAYRQAIEGDANNIEMGDEVSAVEYADAAVRMTQGSGLAMDLAGVQRGAGIIQMMTMFYSYWGTIYQVMAERNIQLRQAGVAGIPNFIGSMTLTWFLPAVLESLLRDIFRSHSDSGDDEEKHKKWLTRMGVNLVTYPAQTWVGARDIAQYLASKATGGYADYKISPIEGAIESLYSPIQLARHALDPEKDVSRSDIEGAFKAAGYWGHLPTAQAYATSAYLYDLMRGNESADDPTRVFGGVLGLIPRDDRKTGAQ